jgi:hypothetical protein
MLRARAPTGRAALTEDETSLWYSSEASCRVEGDWRLACVRVGGGELAEASN